MSRQRRARRKRTKRTDEQTFAEASFKNALKEKMKCDQVTAYADCYHFAWSPCFNG